LALYIFWCGALYMVQDKLLFPADMAGEPLKLLPFGEDTVELTRYVDGVHVTAWFLPAYVAEAARPAPLLVFFHGNAELIDHQFDLVEQYRKRGFAVLLPEYRGYGRSGGIPGEKAFVDDARHFLDAALKRLDVDASRVVYHGRSLGGGPAAGLAALRKPAAMVLESTFTSAAAMARTYWAPTFLVRNPFRVDRTLEALDIPVLIFHGTTDEIISVEHGRALRDLARRGTYVEYDCRHNDFPGNCIDDYWIQIDSYLKKAAILTEVAP
jgi:fermentation-respiration switch protein FrsA (DUF1100 family)